MEIMYNFPLIIPNSPYFQHTPQRESESENSDYSILEVDLQIFVESFFLFIQQFITMLNSTKQKIFNVHLQIVVYTIEPQDTNRKKNQRRIIIFKEWGLWKSCSSSSI